jgi:uncharacterized repeat protein (TIGR03803 family)
MTSFAPSLARSCAALAAVAASSAWAGYEVHAYFGPCEEPFTTVNGTHPMALVDNGDGSVVGVTHSGSTNGMGSIFRVGLRDSTFETLYAFSYPTAAPGTRPPRNPISLVRADSGVFYGTTGAGGEQQGEASAGTVYAYRTGENIQMLHAFDPSSAGINADGIEPRNLLLGQDGRLYGTAAYGGENGTGVVFALDPATQDFELLHVFSARTCPEQGCGPAECGEACGTPDGSHPTGLSMGADGKLYGATAEGGTRNTGALFKIDPQTKEFTTLHSFGLVGPSILNGYSPTQLVRSADGDLYGTTCLGGSSNNGTAFRIAAGSGELTNESFTDDFCPEHLIAGPDGAFFAGARKGLYRISPSLHLSRLHRFDDYRSPSFPCSRAYVNHDGAYPTSLTRLTDGTLAGTNLTEGPGGDGTVFTYERSGGGSLGLEWLAAASVIGLTRRRRKGLTP